MLIFLGADIPITTKNVNFIENKSLNKLIVYITKIKPHKNIPPPIKQIKSTNQEAEDKTKTTLDKKAPYNEKQLSKHPRPRYNTDLELPLFDGKSINGKISAYTVIDELGEIVEIEIINSDLPDNVSDEIISRYSRTLFFPGEVNGKAVTSKTKITIKVNSEEYRNASDSNTRFESIK